MSGNKLKVTYDEPLDEGSTPPGSSFRVTAMPDGGACGNGASGALSRAASGDGPANIGGTGTASIDGATVTVTLDRPVAPGERLVVSYDRPGENAIRDPAGAEAAEFTAQPATNVAAVTAVAVVTDAGADDTYALGETIRVRVTFGVTVAVDTSGGTPRVKIKMDPRWSEFWASYASVGGTNALTFVHTVAEPNTSPTGIAVLANTLEANGGTIRSAATQADAGLSHAGRGHDAKHKVNWRLSPPGTAAVTARGGGLGRGRGRHLCARRDHPGARHLRREGGGGHVGRHAAGEDQDGPALGRVLGNLRERRRHERAHFRATRWRSRTPPRPGLRCSRTRWRRAAAPSGRRRRRDEREPGAWGARPRFAKHKVNWRLAPSGTAAVTGVAVVSNAGADDTYALGETIRVRVTFGETVAVDTSGGTPRVKIKMDPRWGEFWASIRERLRHGGAHLCPTRWREPNTSPDGDCGAREHAGG